MPRRVFRRQRLLWLQILVFVSVPVAYHAWSKSGALPPGDERYAIHKHDVTGRRLLQEGKNCTDPAILNFPQDIFSQQELRHGAVFLHFVLSCYLFVLLAVVCDDYFVPSLECLCEEMDMSTDVAGATFMAGATSSPELFINVIATFVTEGDVGIGTIVGSAVFNILAVAACCGLFVGKVVILDWWPLTRDSIAYGLTVVCLILVIFDEIVMWYEALALVLLYGLYILVMYFNSNLTAWARRRSKKKIPCNEGSSLLRSHESGTPDSPPSSVSASEQATQEEIERSYESIRSRKDSGDNNSSSGEPHVNVLCSMPKEGFLKQLYWLLIWPLNLLLFLTIPDCRKERLRRFYPVTFIMCVIWIGGASYLVTWMITVIGDTLGIPDSVMGLTFLAAGTSIPEAVSSVIVSKQGMGTMGISSSIGSNTFDILLCLGLPWLIKSSFLPTEGHYIAINSRGLDYSALSLLSTLLLLYVTFCCNRFRLDKKVGVACLLMYAAFLVVACLIELNVFFVVNLPTCER